MFPFYNNTKRLHLLLLLFHAFLSCLRYEKLFAFPSSNLNYIFVATSRRSRNVWYSYKQDNDHSYDPSIITSARTNNYNHVHFKSLTTLQSSFAKMKNDFIETRYQQTLLFQKNEARFVIDQTNKVPSIVSSILPIKSSRRNLLQCLVNGASSVSLILTIVTTNQKTAVAYETVGKDPQCNDRTCLGVWDGLLADCPHPSTSALSAYGMGGSAGCVSSQDDTPGVFAEPWDYSEQQQLPETFGNNNEVDFLNLLMDQLLNAIQEISSNRGDTVEVVARDGPRYIRVRFVDGKSSETSIGEFYFTPNDTTIQFRLAAETAPFDSNKISTNSKGFRITSSFRNMDRAELIRKKLRYLKLPILRNRKRSFFFIESDFDTFGPGSASLGPPAEMKRNDILLDPQQNNIDILSNFPKIR